MADQDGARLRPGGLTLERLRALARGGEKIRLDEACWPAVEAAARVVEAAARGEAAVYGVNTGFGRLATTRDPPADMLELQRRLVLLAHAPASARPCPTPWSAWSWRSRSASLALGHSGRAGGRSSSCC